MTALDDHFGERKSAQMPIAVTKTNWPTQPEHLRPILDLWDELRGEVHSVQAKKQRVNGAIQWYEENRGAALELLKRANRYAEDRMLDVTSPGSLVFYALKYRKQDRPATEKYGQCPDCGRGWGTHDDDCHRAKKFSCEDCGTDVEQPTKDNLTTCPSCGLEYEWEAQHE